MPRIDGRNNDQIRPARIVTGFQEFAEGSVLVETGMTRVVCAASIEERAPFFLRGQGKGWVTAEYGMLPRSTLTRPSRERSSGSGRTHEIQRLIGRSLRSVTQLEKLGERTITIDCDVLQADGGTRTAAITGAYVALYQALLGLVRHGVLLRVPLSGSVAATSVGLVGGQTMLDLCYEEDSRAAVDLNVVMTNGGEFVEVQGTGEEHPFSRTALDEMLDLAAGGIRELTAVQEEAVQRLTAG
ncbi:MAG: ribonuclease PH [Chloroflexi bacterium]|nr:ribonuclease PH [Chloroflexota bacterium]